MPEDVIRDPVPRRLTALLALWLPLAAVAAELEIYRPRHRPAEELAPLAAALMEPEGTAVADPRSGALVLRGPAANVARTLVALRALDVRSASFRVESALIRLSELAAAGLELEGWRALGGVRVGRIAARVEGLRLRARALLAAGERRFSGRVSVLDGHDAELWTGSTRLEPAVARSARGVRESTVAVRVRTGLGVRPRSLPDGRIELELAPVAAERGAGGAIVRAGAATTLAVRAGEPFVLAGVSGRGAGDWLGPPGAAGGAAGSGDLVLLVAVERVE